MCELTSFSGTLPGLRSDDLVLFTDSIENNQINQLHEYIVSLATENHRGLCSMEIAKNEIHRNDGWSCELIYVLDNEKYELYDVDYRVTFNKNIHHLRDLLELVRVRFSGVSY